MVWAPSTCPGWWLARSTTARTIMASFLPANLLPRSPIRWAECHAMSPPWRYDAHHCAGRWFYPRRCRSGYGCRGRSRCSGRRLRRRWRLGLPTSENGQEGNCNALDSQGIVHQISPVSFLAQPRCRLCSGRSRQEELLGGCDFDSKPHGWARAATARGVTVPPVRVLETTLDLNADGSPRTGT